MSCTDRQFGSLFQSRNVQRLFRDKYVVFMGDSNIRSYYKDLIVLSQDDVLISNAELRAKMEPSFRGDTLVSHGKQYNGRNYREHRSYRDFFRVDFFYLTRVFNEYVKEVIDLIKTSRPDVIILNSCLWDVTRWGEPWSAIPCYKENMRKLLQLLKDEMPEDCLVIWITTMPCSQNMTGGFLVKELEFTKFSLRFHVVESNIFAAKLMKEYNFDVLDSNYTVSKILHTRSKDGIHWVPPTVRLLTNTLLRHISLAWGTPLPSPLKELGGLGFEESEYEVPSDSEHDQYGKMKKPNKNHQESRQRDTQVTRQEELAVAQMRNSGEPQIYQQLPNQNGQENSPWLQINLFQPTQNSVIDKAWPPPQHPASATFNIGYCPPQVRKGKARQPRGGKKKRQTKNAYHV